MGSAGHCDNLKTRSVPDEPRKANQEWIMRMIRDGFSVSLRQTLRDSQKGPFAHVTKTPWFHWAPTLRKYIAFYARFATGLCANIGGFMPPERGNASVFSGDCTKSDGLPGFSVPLLPKPHVRMVARVQNAVFITFVHTSIPHPKWSRFGQFHAEHALMALTCFKFRILRGPHVSRKPRKFR